LRYTDQYGKQQDAEPWCPGPLYQTVWALRADGSPVIINVRNWCQVDAETPPPPLKRLDRKLVSISAEVRHRKRLADLKKEWYGRKQLRQWGIDASTIVEPTEDEVLAADTVEQIEVHNQKVGKIYREAHTASTPISDKRFHEFWEEDAHVQGWIVRGDD
jgi:hypothetical protein